MPDKLTLGQSASSKIYWRIGISLIAFVLLAVLLRPFKINFLIFLVMPLGLIIRDVTMLFASYRNGQRWKDLTTRLDLIPPVVSKIKTIGSELIDRDFKPITSLDSPSSLAGNLFGQSLLVTISLLLGCGATLLVRPGGNWLTVIAFGVGLLVLALLANRIHLLVRASKQTPHYRRLKTNSVPDINFYQFHTRALQLLGFECLEGLFKANPKERIAFAISTDQPTWAELSFVRNKENWQANCQFKSLMNDGTLVTTESQSSGEPESEVSVDCLPDALYMHHVEVERYCLAHQKKVAVVAKEELLDVYRYIAITDKLILQELVSVKAASVLHGWDWFPNWLRAPIANFS